jgi:hypothetical protein
LEDFYGRLPNVKRGPFRMGELQIAVNNPAMLGIHNIKQLSQ